MLNGSLKPVSFSFEAQESLLALTAEGSLGPLSLSWSFRCKRVEESQLLFEVLIDPLVRLSLLFQERESHYLNSISKLQERIETMQSMFDLHGIQSGLQPITATIPQWEDTTTTLTVHSVLSPLTMASQNVVKEEVPKIETVNDPTIVNIELKRRRREELLKQSQQKSPAKKKRAF
jgi:hypothetical protein